jgi:hypothetical protein
MEMAQQQPDWRDDAGDKACHAVMAVNMRTGAGGCRSPDSAPIRNPDNNLTAFDSAGTNNRWAHFKSVWLFGMILAVVATAHGRSRPQHPTDDRQRLTAGATEAMPAIGHLTTTIDPIL